MYYDEMAQNRRQIKRGCFPDSPREMSRLRDVQHIRSRTWGCEKGIIGRSRCEWEDNVKLILKKFDASLTCIFKVAKNSKVGKKCLQRSSNSV